MAVDFALPDELLPALPRMEWEAGRLWAEAVAKDRMNVELRERVALHDTALQVTNARLCPTLEDNIKLSKERDSGADVEEAGRQPAEGATNRGILIAYRCLEYSHTENNLDHRQMVMFPVLEAMETTRLWTLIFQNNRIAMIVDLICSCMLSTGMGVQ